MRKIISMLACSTVGVIAAGSLARADRIAHYECAVVGFPSPEPIGDRPDHNLLTVEYSCVGIDGPAERGGLHRVQHR
jgi:hypothetical protein